LVSEQKRQALADMRRSRPIVHERSGGRCEAKLPGTCLGVATNMHHRKAEGQGGLSLPANLLDLCGSGTTGCHGWIEHNRTQSYDWGFLVKSTGDPELIPVWTGGRRQIPILTLHRNSVIDPRGLAALFGMPSRGEVA
jgi:hypothetical protein